MLRPLPVRLPLLGVAAMIAVLVVHLATDGLDWAFAGGRAVWFQALAFAGCGAAVVGRAVATPRERAAWGLLAAGLLLYAAGSVYFNLAHGDDPSPPFPSVADALWLALYPLAIAGIVLLARHRFGHVAATVWLDGIIGGAVVAAAAAAVIFEPVFEITVAGGPASVARLAYPLGDPMAMGFIVAVASFAARRAEAAWPVLGLGFALLALADSAYVVEAARGTWAPGGIVDLPYALATALIAGAAWRVPAQRAHGDRPAASNRLPVMSALVAVVLGAWHGVADLNPLAGGLILFTLLAVVLRFALTLHWLTRQRGELITLAASDPLTGLANHRTVQERLARARADGAALAVVALDIDHFKALNDTFGHAAGDAALQAIAQALRAECRPGDLVGRVGGEEFAIVLPGADSAAAYAVAERCRQALATVPVPGARLTCSAGVAAHPADTGEGHGLLELADGALYWAKRAGRNQVRRYDPGNVALTSSAHEQEQILALLGREDALVPVFQPIVELATGRIAGFEALTRFAATPARAPDAWFAQARRCGLGGTLEARAIELALAQPGRPADTFLALNLSVGALLSEQVAGVLPNDLSDIVIELTENELFSCDGELDLQLEALRARGARIAVDDAGAGYSGLQQLIRVKPDILKMDRSLIEGVHADSSKIALLEALSRFATTTGAAVCAEGIEELDELRLIAGFDVTYAQGYVLARPAPAWPPIAAEVAGEVTSEHRWGMRVAAGLPATAGPVTLGQVSDALASIRTVEDLNAAVQLIGRLTHADDVAVSRVLTEERCVETLSAHWYGPTDQRYSYDDYPSTGLVVTHQTVGQIVAGDPAAHPAELAILADLGYRALLMAPIVVHGETTGLVEIYRRQARPWTATEIDQARTLAHHLGHAVGRQLSER